MNSSATFFVGAEVEVDADRRQSGFSGENACEAVGARTHQGHSSRPERPPTTLQAICRLQPCMTWALLSGEGDRGHKNARPMRPELTKVSVTPASVHRSTTDKA